MRRGCLVSGMSPLSDRVVQLCSTIDFTSQVVQEKMSQSHYGNFSMCSEITPPLTTAGVWLGLSSVWQNCLSTPKCHNIVFGFFVCMFLFKEFSQLHMERGKTN